MLAANKVLIDKKDNIDFQVAQLTQAYNHQFGAWQCQIIITGGLNWPRTVWMASLTPHPI